MRDPEFLPVMESFYTIQGEGYFSGTPAYFVRLGGCDVGCHWCDVKESWDATQFDWVHVNKIVDQAKALVTPARSMRWHPIVIKWCLKTWSHSHTLYENLRQICQNHH